MWAHGAAAILVLRNMGSQRACGLIWEPAEVKSSSVEEENIPGEGTGRCPDSEARTNMGEEARGTLEHGDSFCGVPFVEGGYRLLARSSACGSVTLI